MSALEEVRAGAVGEEFLSLLRRTIRAVGITRNFPPPDGLAAWNDDAVGIIVSEFLVDPQTPRRLTDLAALCANDRALAARIQGAVRNFLADLGRRTPIGKLVLRINDVLDHQDAVFTRVDGRWALVEGPASPGRSDLDRLVGAIRTHTIEVPKWGHNARREAPVADVASIVTLCRTLIETASGSLTTRTMAAAIGVRLNIGYAPLSLDANALDGGWDVVRNTENEALRGIRAKEILALLNDRERLSLACPEYTVRDLAPLLGVGSSQAHLIRRNATEIVRAELVDDEDAEGVAAQVIELAKIWSRQWTAPVVPT